MLDGKVVLRRVRTGYRTKEEYDGLEYTLYRLAGEVHFKDGFVVEALHLTDGVMEFVEISDEKFGNRRDKTHANALRHQRRELPDRDQSGHLPALPAFLHLPGGAEGAARPFLKKVALRLSGYPLFFPITS